MAYILGWRAKASQRKQEDTDAKCNELLHLLVLNCSIYVDKIHAAPGSDASWERWFLPKDVEDIGVLGAVSQYPLRIFMANSCLSGAPTLRGK
jgi:hypothetical protein